MPVKAAEVWSVTRIEKNTVIEEGLSLSHLQQFCKKFFESCKKVVALFEGIEYNKGTRSGRGGQNRLDQTGLFF